MINVVISITGAIISLLGLIQVTQTRILEKQQRIYLLGFFSILIGYILSDLISQLSSGFLGPGWNPVSQLGLFFESLFSALLIPLLTSFLLYCSGEENRHRNLAFRTNVGLLSLYIGLLIFTQFSTAIYYYDELNQYHRGPWYPVLLVPPVLMMIINLGLLWSRRGKLSSRQKIALTTYILLPAGSMILQMIFFGIYFIILGSSLAAFVMLTFVITDQTEYYYRQEAEIANMKNEILLSQIQPHFVVNTLGAIAHLSRDAPEARQAIHMFSRYIRGNINVLSQNASIPFTQELEHTRLYLDLERLRFGDSLRVEWDLQCVEFMIPSLTLQPMVENAVRHGVRGNSDGRGTVRIATRETDGAYEIIVSDDGPGFDPKAKMQDGQIHVGIDNVRERLRIICGGELRIESGPGKGTRVVILLPRKEADSQPRPEASADGRNSAQTDRSRS